MQRPWRNSGVDLAVKRQPDSPDDPAQQIGWDYYHSIRQYKRKEVVYTPPEIVRFIINSSVKMAYEKHHAEGDADIAFRALDPFCGGGIFPLFTLRLLSRLMTISKKEIVENCIIGVEIDLGGVNTTKRSLRHEVGENCKTKILWGDTFAEYVERSDHLEHITDLAEIEKLNKEFLGRRDVYMQMQKDGKIPAPAPIRVGAWSGFSVWDDTGHEYDFVS